MGRSGCRRSSRETARYKSWPSGGSRARRRSISSKAGGAGGPASGPRAGGGGARAEGALLAGTPGLLDERVLAWPRAAALLRLASKVYVVERRKENWLDRAHALLTEATRLAERAARPDPVARIEAPALRLNGAALELILRALSTRPATPEELDQIRKLLDERKQRDQNA